MKRVDCIWNFEPDFLVFTAPLMACLDFQRMTDLLVLVEMREVPVGRKQVGGIRTAVAQILVAEAPFKQHN